MMNTANDLVR